MGERESASFEASVSQRGIKSSQSRATGQLEWVAGSRSLVSEPARREEGRKGMERLSGGVTSWDWWRTECGGFCGAKLRDIGSRAGAKLAALRTRGNANWPESGSGIRDKEIEVPWKK